MINKTAIENIINDATYTERLQLLHFFASIVIEDATCENNSKEELMFNKVIEARDLMEDLYGFDRP